MTGITIFEAAFGLHTLGFTRTTHIFSKYRLDISKLNIRTFKGVTLYFYNFHNKIPKFVLEYYNYRFFSMTYISLSLSGYTGYLLCCQNLCVFVNV